MLKKKEFQLFPSFFFFTKLEQNKISTTTKRLKLKVNLPSIYVGLIRKNGNNTKQCSNIIKIIIKKIKEFCFCCFSNCSTNYYLALAFIDFLSINKINRKISFFNF